MEVAGVGLMDSEIRISDSLDSWHLHLDFLHAGIRFKPPGFWNAHLEVVDSGIRIPKLLMLEYGFSILGF